ncbi:MAG: hypothetical protein WBP33_00825 [Saprospiraceae bacterium]
MAKTSGTIRTNIKARGNYLYHGTNEDVLNAISKEGLKPMGRGALSLSKTKKYAELFAQEGITPSGKTKGIMLRIKSNLLDGKTISGKKTRPKTDQLFEVLTKKTISPESIEIKIGNNWHPLNKYISEKRKK